MPAGWLMESTVDFARDVPAPRRVRHGVPGTRALGRPRLAGRVSVRHPGVHPDTRAVTADERQAAHVPDLNTLALCDAMWCGAGYPQRTMSSGPRGVGAGVRTCATVASAVAVPLLLLLAVLGGPAGAARGVRGHGAPGQPLLHGRPPRPCRPPPHIARRLRLGSAASDPRAPGRGRGVGPAGQSAAPTSGSRSRAAAVDGPGAAGQAGVTSTNKRPLRTGLRIPSRMA
jgi:hypothetical protein